MAGRNSDHFDGKRFFNPGAQQASGFGAILRWQWTRQRAVWPDWLKDPLFPPPEGAVPPAHVALTFIGHSTFLIRWGLPDGRVFTLLTDPVFSARCSPVFFAGPKRHRAPGLALDALPKVDAVLVSHNHYDHLDLPSLRAIRQRSRPEVVTAIGNARLLKRGGIPRAGELDWWEQATVGPLQVTAVPARHFAARTPFDRNRALWVGFMISDGRHQMLFAGDSGYGPHWGAIRERLGPPGLALLPIGAYEPRDIMRAVHMNPAEAVQARADLGARRAIGMHFGTFQLTDEAIDAPVEELARLRAEHGLLREAFDVLGFGETRELPLD